MSALDPRTIIAIAILMSALMAIVLTFMRASYPRTIHGLGLWALAAATWVLSAILYANRDAHWPESVLVIAPNLLLMLGSVTYLAGCQRFFGQPTAWRRWAAFLLIALLILIWQTFVQPSYVLRLVTVTCAIGIIYAANLWFLLRHGSARLAVRLVQTVLLAHLLVVAARLVTIATGQASGHLYESTTMQVIYVASFVVCQLLYCIGAILMATDRLASEYARQARFDPLTGVYNRRALLEYCADELVRSQRTGRGPALMMLDLDHFKAINDRHGHQHGDEVLRHFSRQARASLRPADRLGRYGGEEFVVLLPEADLDAASSIAGRIHAALHESQTLACTVSIGITTWQGKGDTLDAMLARADRALYDAKAQGRNRICHT